MKLKRILALLLAVIITVSFVGCGSSVKDEDLANKVDEIAEELNNIADILGEGAPAGEESGEDVDAPADEDTPADEEGEEVTDESGETVTDASGEAVTVAPTNNGGSTSKTTKKSGSSSKTPSTTAEILSLYNSATKQALSAKAGYSKHRSSTLDDYSAGAVLSAFKSIVLGFMGVGSENEFKVSNVKGQEKPAKGAKDENINESPLRASTLTANDIKSAKLTKNGANYVITITVKDGSSSIEGGANSKNNSPIDKCGISVGDSDRKEFDHKTAQGIYDAIEGTASSTVVSEKSSAITVTATVNATSNNLVGLVVKFKSEVNLSKVMGSKATIVGTTTVTYSDFKF